ncbi:unnamed protein product [Owenia fusiformis]|uniref:Uncharacterized protein n=1 Tax=Owenia fusiformis TaxID=6347 RepID=A0A8J1UDT6_OWEFU|nr:unnamed protein product [Owenia fusiformis]
MTRFLRMTVLPFLLSIVVIYNLYIFFLNNYNGRQYTGKIGKSNIYHYKSMEQNNHNGTHLDAKIPTTLKMDVSAIEQNLTDILQIWKGKVAHNYLFCFAMSSPIFLSLVQFEYDNDDMYAFNCDSMKTILPLESCGKGYHKECLKGIYSGETDLIQRLTFGNEIIIQNGTKVVIKHSNKADIDSNWIQEIHLITMREIMLYSALQSEDLAIPLGFCIQSKNGNSSSMKDMKRHMHNILYDPEYRELEQITVVYEYLDTIESYIKSESNRSVAALDVFNQLMNIDRRLYYTSIGVSKHLTFRDVKMDNYLVRYGPKGSRLVIADLETIDVRYNTEFTRQCNRNAPLQVVELTRKMMRRLQHFMPDNFPTNFFDIWTQYQIGL